jgi:hypothetical protein
MVLLRTCAVLVTVLLFSPLTGLAQQNAPQQKPPQPRKLSDAEKKEIQVVVKITDDIVAGQPAPNDLSLTWLREDILKALGNKEYVPFSVSIDPTKISTPTVSLYWRVVSKDAAAAAPAGGKKDEKKKDGKSDYPWEELGSVTIPPGQKDPIRISRSFMVGPGNYDLIVVAKEPVPEKAPKNAPPQKTSAIKQSITVPDLWNDQLSTSTVIVAERIDDLNEPLTPKQQSERPYAMGSMEIIPVVNTKFKKTAELQTFVLIYNAKTHPDGKPDVLVEYSFYTKQGGAEKFFNKTNPQSLNAQTLPPQFDLASGYQLQSGQAVPLASFPEGEYRLEIKITDKVGNKSLTRDVNFSVSGS